MDNIQETARGTGGTRGGGALGRLMGLWIAACAVVIVLGLNRMYPQYGERLSYAFRDPAMALTKPFATCKIANAAGYFNIPRDSSAYVRWQDEDNDGMACEPAPGVATGRLELIQKRLTAPMPKSSASAVS
ncbi:excalibur calcium-binding domain-containing protein [Phenylobacterium sp.]|uniref:excalibur calcium-binding domain-containing protein n=1 Tax=Phenylobacterium sp. TaxID=1871053 RepID=UPI0035680553